MKSLLNSITESKILIGSSISSDIKSTKLIADTAVTATCVAANVAPKFQLTLKLNY